MSANRSARPASANSTARLRRNRMVIVSPTEEVTLISLDQKVNQLDQKVNRLDQRVDHLDQTVTRLDKTVTELGHTVTKLNESVVILSQAVTGILATVKDMQAYMTIKFEAVDKRFDAADKRFDTIEVRVGNIEKTMSRFDAYMKTEAKIQEGRDTQFIVKLYYHNHPTHTVDRLNIREFYLPNNNILTDFDGILLVHNVSIPWAQPLQPMDIVEYIIIESKHSLDKGKIDNKLKQMTDLFSFLGKADDEKFMESSEPRFQESIHRLMGETKLPADYLRRPIHLLFASDDISHEVGLYIKAISEGISSEAEYDAITKVLFDNDQYVRSIMERLRKTRDGTISKATHRLIHPVGATMASIREAFLNQLKPFIEKPLQPYLIPYSTLESRFQRMKGQVGMSQFGLVEHSPLFPTKGLNRNL